MVIGFVLISADSGREHDVYHGLTEKYMKKSESAKQTVDFTISNIPCSKQYDLEVQIQITDKASNELIAESKTDLGELVLNANEEYNLKTSIYIGLPTEDMKNAPGEILEIKPLFGEYDMIAKIYAKGFNEIGEFVVDCIRAEPGVTGTKTLTGITF